MSTGAPLLHNMSMPPATRVQRITHTVFGTVCRFEFARARGIDPAAVLRGDVPSGLVEQAEQAWREWALRGAVLVFTRDRGTSPPDWRWCTDPLVLLNVLGRTRGAVLLPHTPLDLRPKRLESQLASDDPRLVALAAEKEA